MTKKEVMQALESMGSEQTKKVLTRHGAREPFYGVKVGDMKKLVKKIKKDHELSLELYATGNSDAMYLAGLIADEKKISKEQLQEWAQNAYWYMISEYTVAWIAAESPYGWELGLKWIDSDDEMVAACGWSTLSSILSITPDDQLNLPAIERLLDRIGDTLQQSPNRVRYTMNGFVISTGGYVSALTSKAQEIADKVGQVNVNMGETACKVPPARPYIQKMVDGGRVGKKRKMARC